MTESSKIQWYQVAKTTKDKNAGQLIFVEDGFIIGGQVDVCDPDTVWTATEKKIMNHHDYFFVMLVSKDKLVKPDDFIQRMKNLEKSSPLLTWGILAALLIWIIWGFVSCVNRPTESFEESECKLVKSKLKLERARNPISYKTEELEDAERSRCRKNREK